ncbi:MAG: ABC transporter permease [Vampirovibrionales bacterium]|nr:ABC transporter permease [Vampirovibrionales bacterium]
MSSLVMDSIATELRIAGRIVHETVGGIRRSGWMNVVITITMAAILGIFGTIFAFLIETQLFFQNIGAGFEISVYLADNARLDDVKPKIMSVGHVKSLEIIPKERAWTDMRKNLNAPDIDNPLPDTIHVRMDGKEYIPGAVEKIQRISGVQEVNYSRAFLKKLEDISNVVSGVGFLLSLFLGGMTMLVISNTIHLLIEARAREIEILRMMGVGNWYIRLPFLFQGAMYGLLGAIIAYLPLSAAIHYLQMLFESFDFSSSGFSLSFVFTVLALMGVLVGAGGAANSVHKYLKI